MLARSYRSLKRLLSPAVPVSRLDHLLTRLDSETLPHDFSLIPLTFLEDLEDPAKVLPAHRGKLLYDLSTEALTYSGITSQKLAAFHRLLRQAGVDGHRVYLINANYHAPATYNAWQQQHSPDYRIHVAGYNFYLFEYFCELRESAWFQQNQARLLDFTRRTADAGILRQKHFMCLNLRPRAHRWAVVLHLMQRGWLEKGLVSFFGEAFGPADASSVESEEACRRFIASLPSGPRLLPFFDRIRAQTPLMLERSPERMRQDLWQRQPGEVDFLIPEINDKGDIEEISSYFEIVTETWFSGPENLYLTEKTIRPFIRLQPFIHVGAPHALEYLRQAGFKTFTPWINEAYDAIEDELQRMEAIFAEIDRLCAMEKEEIHALYVALLPVLAHNFLHFTTQMDKLCAKEVKRMMQQLES